MKNLIWILISAGIAIGGYSLYSGKSIVNENVKNNYIENRTLMCQQKWFDFETKTLAQKLSNRNNLVQCYVKINGKWVPEENVSIQDK